eukprot:CAMPEP_0168508714 /NCGR_PEP_ID=MMETSP0405-20121227/298_1 /TAXON_ID=498012 /ORGANISM="Trichosphaerium sp, Strain Am-I-7 wt" /LENGTH=571 /DNA_ID=CAMNT_0008525941 /DNA_START=236 /DNA_END=1951 /DNA_ORIENTATION=-
MMKVTALVGQGGENEEPKLFTNGKPQTRTNTSLASHPVIPIGSMGQYHQPRMDYKFEVGSTLENPALRNLRPRRRAHSAPPANMNAVMHGGQAVPLQTAQVYQPMDLVQEEAGFHRNRKRRRPMSESYTKLELQHERDSNTWAQGEHQQTASLDDSWVGRGSYHHHQQHPGYSNQFHKAPFMGSFSGQQPQHGAPESKPEDNQPKIKQVIVNNTNPIRDGHGYPIEIILSHPISTLGNPTISEIKHIYDERDAVMSPDDPGLSYVKLGLQGLKLQPNNVFSIQEIDVKEACLIRLKVKFTCRPRAFLKNFPNGSFVRMSVTLMFPDNGRWSTLFHPEATFRFNPNNCKPKNGRFCHISPSKYVSEEDNVTFIIGENLAKDIQVYFGNLRCEVLPAQESRSYACWRGVTIPPMEAVLKANHGSEHLVATGNGEWRVRVRVLQKAKSKFVTVEGEQFFSYKPYRGLQTITRQLGNFTVNQQAYPQQRGIPMAIPHTMPPLQDHSMHAIQEEEGDQPSGHYIHGYPPNAQMEHQRPLVAPMPQYAQHQGGQEGFLPNDQAAFIQGPVGAVSYGY